MGLDSPAHLGIGFGNHIHYNHRDFYREAQMDINWYPGHMLKARRMMENSLKAVDFVIEVVDARIPEASRNPDFDDLFGTKARVLVLNKADMADPVITREWLDRCSRQGLAAVEFVATARRGRDGLIRMMQQAAEEKVRRMAERGAKKTVRALVAGIPNVGKSTLINALAGAASAKTGDKPGVTRGKQLIRITPWMELMDTPGVLWPKLDDPKGALNLAFTGAVKEEVMDSYRLALELISALAAQYPAAVRERYKLEGTADSPEETLAAIAVKRGCLKAGGTPDEERAARILLDEMKAGKLGRMTLERPGDDEDRKPIEL